MYKSGVKLSVLIKRFLKVGIIGFGGGSALIPIVRNEIVEHENMMSDEDYLKHTVIANITPGALPVKLGATCGSELKGIVGSIGGAYAVMFPGCFLTVLLIALFTTMSQGAIKYLNYASIGITIFIVFLLYSYVNKTLRENNLKTNLILCALAVAITVGKEIRELFILLLRLEENALGTPLFDISMIHVMLISFYLIFYLQNTKTDKRKYIGIAFAAAYTILNGKLFANIPWTNYLKWIVTAGIIISLIEITLYIRRKNQKNGRVKSVVQKEPFIKGMTEIVLFLAIPFVIGIMSILLCSTYTVGETLRYLFNILISTLTSFGGGEAYVAVADSIFVSGGYVAAETFYTQIVPVANALPGPILIKIASAIGFVWGNASGSYAEGIAIAIASATLSTGACSSIAILVLRFYDKLKNSIFINSLKIYILPIICGTLISTMLSMLNESMKITESYGLFNPVVLVMMVIGAALTVILHKKVIKNDLILLIGWIIISLCTMTLIV